MKYICNKCNKSFTKKYNYTVHINRKNACDDFSIINNEDYKNDENDENDENGENNENDESNENILKNDDIIDNTCPYCHKKFFQKSNVKIHINNKSCRAIKEKQKKKMSDQEMIDKMKEMMENHFRNHTTNNITNNNTTTTTNNINNTNIQVNIYSAGKEDLSRLSQEDILKICTSGTYYPIVAAQVIHCNKNYPEFQNFLISNLRSSTGLVYANDTWVSKSQDEILTNLMRIDKKHVSNLIKDIKVDDKLKVKLESTKDEIDTNEIKEHQKPKIKETLYNASKMIGKNKKTIKKITE